MYSVIEPVSFSFKDENGLVIKLECSNLSFDAYLEQSIVTFLHLHHFTETVLGFGYLRDSIAFATQYYLYDSNLTVGNIHQVVASGISYKTFYSSIRRAIKLGYKTKKHSAIPSVATFITNSALLFAGQIREQKGKKIALTYQEQYQKLLDLLGFNHQSLGYQYLLRYFMLKIESPDRKIDALTIYKQIGLENKLHYETVQKRIREEIQKAYNQASRYPNKYSDLLWKVTVTDLTIRRLINHFCKGFMVCYHHFLTA